MGTRTKASCKCGYSSEYILIGGGKMNFHYTHYYPCLCLDCKDVVQVNIKKVGGKRIDLGLLSGKEKFDNPNEIYVKGEVFSCSKCYGKNVIPYYDERLNGQSQEPEFGTSNYPTVPSDLCHCPKCDKRTLTFMPDILMWD